MVFIFSLDVPLKLSNALSRPFSDTGDAEIFLRHSYSYLRFAILRASQLRTFFKARNPTMTLSALRLQRCRGRSVGTRVSLEKDTLATRPNFITSRKKEHCKVAAGYAAFSDRSANKAFSSRHDRQESRSDM